MSVYDFSVNLDFDLSHGNTSNSDVVTCIYYTIHNAYESMIQLLTETLHQLKLNKLFVFLSFNQFELVIFFIHFATELVSLRFSNGVA